MAISQTQAIEFPFVGCQKTKVGKTSMQRVESSDKRAIISSAKLIVKMTYIQGSKYSITHAHISYYSVHTNLIRTSNNIQHSKAKGWHTWAELGLIVPTFFRNTFGLAGMCFESVSAFTVSPTFPGDVRPDESSKYAGGGGRHSDEAFIKFVFIVCSWD